MNIAFPALFVFILALPGIILRSSYREWAWKIPVYQLPLAENIVWSAFSAALLHAVWCGLAELLGYRVNFADVLILLTGGFGLAQQFLAQRLSAIAAHPCAIASYFLSLNIAAASFGLIAHHFVRANEWDLKFKFLRFDNFWYYALDAKVPYFAENREEYNYLPDNRAERPVAIVIVSCVVNHGSSSFVYYGFPADYDFDQSGKLERLVLESVTYQELCTPREENKRNRASERAKTMGDLKNVNVFPARLPIVGDLFVLNSSDIHNLSVEYAFLTENKQQTISET